MTLEFDPEFAAVLDQLGGTAAFQPPRHDVEGRRAFWEPILAASGSAQPFPDDVETSDRYATAADGAEIRMRWYAKAGATPGSAVVYFHGGGYFFGHIDYFDGTVARYVAASGVPMLSVEYRRAPEHPFPTPTEDGYAALRWLHEHAAELGVDPARIGVMGDSAGGGMAAAVSILARERGGPRIARQVLVMPMLDDRTTPDAHLAPFTYNYGDLVTGWQAFLGDAVGGADVPPAAAPARLEDVTDLPAAYIEVGQLDLFRDEATAYATTLSRAGVPVEFHLHPGVPHEFDGIAFTADVSRRAVADRVRVLRSI